MASWPSSLPTWKLPLSHKADEGVLRTNMSVGPAKLRKRYSAVPTRFQTSFLCNGIQQQILQGFYNQNQASEFERIDPVTGDTQYFRFLTSPEFRTRVGATLPSERQYEVTLSLERMPGSPDKAFTVLLDGDYANPLIGFTRSSPGWYFGSDGLLKESAVDEMRFDYDPATGELLGLLIEEERTNEDTDSDTSNYSTARCTRNGGTSKKGLDGFTYTGDAGSGNPTITSSSTLSAAQYVYSAIIDTQNTSNDVFRLRVYDGVNTLLASFGADFTASTESITTVNSADDSGFIDLGDGVYRIYVVVTIDTAESRTHGIYFEQDQDLIVLHTQLEHGAFPTSPIITEGTTVTRSSDVATVTDLSWYNQQEGTFLVEAINAQGGVFEANKIGNNDERLVIYNNSNVRLVVEGDGEKFSAFNIINGFPDVAKIALGYNSITNIAYGSVNGSEVNTMEANAISSAIDRLQIGYYNTGDLYLNGHIKRLHYYPERLSNAKLQELTR